MRILLTGHDGYIGSVLGSLCTAAGHDVVGLDSGLFSACTFGTQPEPIPWIRKDVRDLTVSDLVGFEAVVHLANLSNDPLGNLDPALTLDINAHESVRIGSIAREAGVERFVFASSCSLYGEAGQAAVTETAAFNPVTPYGVSKVQAEAGLSALASDGFSPTFMRNATVYGVSPRLRFDLVVNNLTAWAISTGAIRMKSDGTPWRPLVHVHDVSTAVLAVLHAPREVVHNEAFNVGREGENYQVRDIARIVGEEVSDCAVSFADGASPDTRSYQVSFAKIAEHLPAWQPRWTVRDGVREVYAGLRDAGLSPDIFEGPRFSRIARLQELIEQGLLDESLRWTEPTLVSK
jgi:nucleoside-diphosphate-sugar epimerase